MNKEKLKIGIIGIGKFALMSHVPALRATEAAEIAAVSRRNPEKLAIIKRELAIPAVYTDWREMLDCSDLDAVLVTTPNGMHAEPTIESLKRGLHVMVEKPMAIKSEEAESMLRTSESSERILMVGYSYRFSGACRTAKLRLRDGAIGLIRQVNVSITGYKRWLFWECDEMPPEIQSLALKVIGMPEEFFDQWKLDGVYHRKSQDAGGGMYVDVGTHTLDLALWFADGAPAEVFAMRDNLGHPIECFVTAQARLTNDVLLSISCADVVSPNLLIPSRNMIEIIGEDGTLFVDLTGDVTINRDGKSEIVESTIPDQSVCGAFVNAIVNDTENPSPASEAIHAVRLTEATYRSIEEKAVITI